MHLIHYFLIHTAISIVFFFLLPVYWKYMGHFDEKGDFYNKDSSLIVLATIFFSITWPLTIAIIISELFYMYIIMVTSTKKLK